MIGDVFRVQIYPGKEAFIKEVLCLSEDNACEGCFFLEKREEQNLCKSTEHLCGIDTRFVEISKDEFEFLSTPNRLLGFCEYCTKKEIVERLVKLSKDKIKYCPVCGRELK